MKTYIGVDLGGTRIKLGVIDEKGNVLKRDNVPTPETKEAIYEVIQTFIKKQEPTYTIAGVGLSTPGVVGNDGYMHTSGAIKCFLHQHVKKELQEYVGMQVHVENDGKCAGAAEKWIGAGSNYTDFVCFTLGTAVGGAIYINNQLVRGVGGSAGEFGAMLGTYGHSDYDEASYSMHAGVVAGLCRSYSYAKRERVLDAIEIYRRKDAGDELAKQCIEEFYHHVAILLVNTTLSLSPQAILIGGGISANEEAMQGIQSHFDVLCKDYHVMTLIQTPPLFPCKLRNDAGMIGAVYLLQQQ